MKKSIPLIVAVLMILGLGVFIQKTYAQSISLAEAKVSITFDDGYLSTYNNALPVLNSRGLKATSFITTGFIGRPIYMNWTQVQYLQNKYGWEIGSHTVSHPELPIVSLSQVKTEVNYSKSILTSKGLAVTSFASPYGAYNNPVLIEVLKGYNLHRGFWDRDMLNEYPYDKSVITVQSGNTAAQVNAWVDQAIAEKRWVVLVFHDITKTTSTDPYATTLANFIQIADHIKSTGVKNVTMNHTLEKPGTNLIANSTFKNGLGDGWTTDTATNVKANKLNNGSYPSSAESVQLTGNVSAIHLFSPAVSANSKATYVLESFVNTYPLTIGEIGFYIDEYNANNQWVSGKYIGTVVKDRVTYFSKTYTPSSASVASFKVQVYLTGQSTGTVYIDNLEVYNLTPNVSDGNMATNGSFESTTNGWANNWSRSSTSFMIDTASQGNQGQNSLHFSNGEAAAYITSDPIIINSANTYVWKQYVDVRQLSGEFGLYIDEYDANNTWISGKWVDALTVGYKGYKEYTYTPTSTQVKNIKLQYYSTGGLSSNVYIDSVYFGN